MQELSVCIVVLSYNGINYLEKLAPTLREAVRKWGKPCAVVILDNQSTSDVRGWVSLNYPEFEFILSPSNDYLYSYNSCLRQRSEDVIILLNNDIKVRPDFIKPLVSHFVRDNVFAVGAASMDWNGDKYTSGPWYLASRRGLYYWASQPEWRRGPCYSLLAVGGHMAVSRLKFISLGGFNRLFYPAYCEEAELCIRAWQKGWATIFEPSSVVYHYDGGSFNDNPKKLGFQLRSYFLLQLSCFPPVRPLITSFVFVAIRFVWYSLTMRFVWPAAFIQAWFRWYRHLSFSSGSRMDYFDVENLQQILLKPL